MKLRDPVRAVGVLGIFVALAMCGMYVRSAAQGTGDGRPEAANVSPVYGVAIPDGYRDWHLISVKRLTGAGGKFNQLRAELGNDVAAKAFRDGALPFPDGASSRATRPERMTTSSNAKR